jgi:hypothetical protein
VKLTPIAALSKVNELIVGAAGTAVTVIDVVASKDSAAVPPAPPYSTMY